MTRCDSSARRRLDPILLVDDYTEARTIVRDALEAAGYSVVEAADGQQALDVLVEPHRRISLVIMDLQMPIMDGWRFIELLNSYVRLSTIPVIVVTAAAQPQLERIRHPAVRACLQAPYELKTLLALVESALQARDTARSSGTG